ncbi:MAG: hypothetical protein XD72_1763 [Methanothrix harundinacea]|uniref:HTH marR-type domain-containing protein n=1 Tax=Methanothrix harundinacea TaxID=301375 RepID=A0A101FSW6_9EURY|nr:MAG: hypothetical protein XD72_1763 [Methanothrix harundinacea]KUK95991.1 MAG: hypothetical protein XE07_1427 [Methanothrix harundinacea]
MNAETYTSGISKESAELDLQVRVKLLEENSSDAFKRIGDLESIVRKTRQSDCERSPVFLDRIFSAKFVLAGTSGMTPKQLCHELGISPSYCSEIIAELISDGYVEEPNPRDRRSKVIKPPEVED